MEAYRSRLNGKDLTVVCELLEKRVKIFSNIFGIFVDGVGEI
ncbi:MAG: hypothetical protein ACXWAX_01775 [Chthoniobacterales bacterium]